MVLLEIIFSLSTRITDIIEVSNGSGRFSWKLQNIESTPSSIIPPLKINFSFTLLFRITLLKPIKGFNSYNFLVAKLAYKIIAYSFEFKKKLDG